MRGDINFLIKHVGHEVKYFAFAVANFKNPNAEKYHTSLQDSALVRARTLIDFFSKKKDLRNAHIEDYYIDGHSVPEVLTIVKEWFEFISARTSHVALNRETQDDKWPDRAHGQDKGDDRLDRLSKCIFELIESNIPAVNEQCARSLRSMINRARQYIQSPNDDTFDLMDPANISNSL